MLDVLALGERVVLGDGRPRPASVVMGAHSRDCIAQMDSILFLQRLEVGERELSLAEVKDDWLVVGNGLLCVVVSDLTGVVTG